MYRPDNYLYESVDEDLPIDVEHNVTYIEHIELQENVCYTTSSRNDKNVIANQSE